MKDQGGIRLKISTPTSIKNKKMVRLRQSGYLSAFVTLACLVLNTRQVAADLPIHCEEHQVTGRWNIHVKQGSCAFEYPSTVVSTLRTDGSIDLGAEHYEWEQHNAGGASSFLSSRASSSLAIKSNTSATSPKGPRPGFSPFATVDLKPRGRLEVISTHDTHEATSDAGTQWTMAYDEGMELRLNGVSFFGFFHFEPMYNENLKHFTDIRPDSFYGENDDGTVSDFKTDCGRTMLGWGTPVSSGRSSMLEVEGNGKGTKHIHDSFSTAKQEDAQMCWYAERADGSIVAAEQKQSSSSSSFVRMQRSSLEQKTADQSSQTMSVNEEQAALRSIGRLLKSPFPVADGRAKKKLVRMIGPSLDLAHLLKGKKDLSAEGLLTAPPIPSTNTQHGAVGFFPVPPGSLGGPELLPPSHELSRDPLKNAAEIETALELKNNDESATQQLRLKNAISSAVKADHTKKTSKSFIPSASSASSAAASSATPDVPVNFDWHASGSEMILEPTTVVNQGQCGSCYALASVAAIESRFRIALRKKYELDVPVTLSAESVVACSVTNQGCNGGLPFLVGRHAKEFGLRDNACMDYYPMSAGRELGFSSYGKCMARKDQCAAQGRKTTAELLRDIGSGLGAATTASSDLHTKAVSSSSKKNSNPQHAESSSKLAMASSKSVSFLQIGPAGNKRSSLLTTFVEGNGPEEAFVGPTPAFVGPHSEDDDEETQDGRYHMSWRVFAAHPQPSRLLPLKFRTPFVETPGSEQASFLAASSSYSKKTSDESTSASSPTTASLLSTFGGLFSSTASGGTENVKTSANSWDRIYGMSSVLNLLDGEAYGKMKVDEKQKFPVYMGNHGAAVASASAHKPEASKLHQLLQSLSFFVKDYGYVGGYYGGCNEELMKREIYQFGPVAIAAEVPGDMEQYAGGIYKPASQPADHLHYLSKKDQQQQDEDALQWELTTHAMVAVGYGASSKGEKYWTLRNSWGTQFGEKGYFLYARGGNYGGIEHQAVWFQPDIDRLEQAMMDAKGQAFAKEELSLRASTEAGESATPQLSKEEQSAEVRDIFRKLLAEEKKPM
ncbi:unnamed protein product [Amoebophrya sp. A25]|nr:unnamed protein product [Amoebophrya sp. A25]|eukprot:GSA25T00011688001.1